VTTNLFCSQILESGAGATGIRQTFPESGKFHVSLIANSSSLSGHIADLVASLLLLLLLGNSGNTNWKTFAEVKAQNLGQEKADYFTSKGTIVFMKKENCMYMVCCLLYCLIIFISFIFIFLNQMRHIS